MMLMGDSITSSQLQQGAALLARSTDGSQASGENMLWEQQVSINRGVLINDPDTTAALFDAMWAHITITSSDGIQSDGSFHFHGPLLYTGEEGASVPGHRWHAPPPCV